MEISGPWEGKKALKTAGPGRDLDLVRPETHIVFHINEIIMQFSR